MCFMNPKSRNSLLLVCGSRTIEDRGLVFGVLDGVDFSIYNGVIHGDADGVDKLTKLYCNINGIPEEGIEPNYELYGRKAPLVRDNEMVVKCKEGIAIWDGKSTGTLYTINRLKEANKLLKTYEVIIFE